MLDVSSKPVGMAWWIGTILVKCTELEGHHPCSLTAVERGREKCFIFGGIGDITD